MEKLEIFTEVVKAKAEELGIKFHLIAQTLNEDETDIIIGTLSNYKEPIEGQSPDVDWFYLLGYITNEYEVLNNRLPKLKKLLKAIATSDALKRHANVL